jgi:hypothetical protein
MLYLRSINRFTLISLALLGLSVSSVNAATVTYGNLTSNDATDFIADTVTGRQYKRFDTFNLTYADTVAAVAAGGAYEGWSIADSVISDEFTEGLFGSATPCSGAESYGTLCGQISGWADGVFGASYNNVTDYYAFISTYDTPEHPDDVIGIVGFNAGNVNESDDWSSIAILNQHDGRSIYQPPINLLLYKEVSPVPVPAAIWLFGTALIGLVGFRCRGGHTL